VISCQGIDITLGLDHWRRKRLQPGRRPPANARTGCVRRAQPSPRVVRYSGQNLFARAAEPVGDLNPREHEFSVQLRAFDASKGGCSPRHPSLCNDRTRRPSQNLRHPPGVSEPRPDHPGGEVPGQARGELQPVDGLLADRCHQTLRVGPSQAIHRGLDGVRSQARGGTSRRSCPS
jgi:hypothetical protein